MTKRTSPRIGGMIQVDIDALMSHIEDNVRNLVQSYTEARMEELLGGMDDNVMLLAANQQEMSDVMTMQHVRIDQLRHRICLLEGIDPDHLTDTTITQEESNVHQLPVRRADDGD
jgi:hypothetical protein